MVKRVVDTSFWTDMHVIDSYSVEDKYFNLYLMTNDKTTQAGIYPLPKKVISFETGFTTDVIQVLLDRFSKTYGKILYSEQTQEVTVLHSLQSTILKGGTPVSDLLEAELSRVKDGSLILATYHEMKSFWELSKRKFDKTIQALFEKELFIRGLLLKEEASNHLDYSQIVKGDSPEKSLEKEQSFKQMNPCTESIDTEEQNILTWYVEYIAQRNPESSEKITPENIVCMYYKQIIGHVSPSIERQLLKWQEKMPRSLILEALHRSIKAKNPIVYTATILESWMSAGVKNYEDVINLDKNHTYRRR